ncbi:MAG TPA: DNA recombination protein RmuC [Bacillota bacterium]|nr:DNA recombination protein RmuC [Bacillota bacterium]HOR85907.1 DNA recombination protein RmuC [Bacillota bacterium]
MLDILLYVITGLLATNLIILIIIMKNSPADRIIKLETCFETMEKDVDKLNRTIMDEMLRNREELAGSIKVFNGMITSQMSEISGLQRSQLDIFSQQLANLTQANEYRLEKMRETIEEKLKYLQEDNNKKLDQMRATVDEKLNATLEQRLGESFRLVSERLEMVHKGLGEMQALATGVGDLKKVLTNVKTRGTWGEIQLGNILEQILTPEQYSKNVATRKNSSDRVEYAIKLPGRDGKEVEAVWLPIDSKFPQEDYQRLIDAQEQGNPAKAEEASKALEVSIKNSARDIRNKYINPPGTTDFGIMFLPTEGLYAEVLRRPGLCDCLQQQYRIVAVGPTNLVALLNSLQMGFRTIAIEKRSSEVWNLLGAVKTEFGKFGDILDKTQKKLQEASNTIEDAARKSRSIGRKLKNVQELPTDDSAILLEDGEDMEPPQIAASKDN